MKPAGDPVAVFEGQRSRLFGLSLAARQARQARQAG